MTLTARQIAKAQREQKKAQEILSKVERARELLDRHGRLCGKVTRSDMGEIILAWHPAASSMVSLETLDNWVTQIKQLVKKGLV